MQLASQDHRSDADRMWRLLDALGKPQMESAAVNPHRRDQRKGLLPKSDDPPPARGRWPSRHALTHRISRVFTKTHFALPGGADFRSRAD